MATETRSRSAAAPPGAIYALGIIGAWVWFWRQADGFWPHAWAIIQGILWPAYLIYDAFRALH